MRIDLPQCGFHYCRFQFDGNCTSTGKYEKCEYRYLSEQIEPGRKKGKWIDKSDGIEGAWNYCSVCGEQAIDLYDFCPNCGADMREGEEE